MVAVRIVTSGAIVTLVKYEVLNGTGTSLKDLLLYILHNDYLNTNITKAELLPVT
jgi:hypothetical protein